LRPHKPAESQITFAEINGISKIHSLSDNQRKILALVNCKLTQAQIADKLHVSSSYVCQTIGKLRAFNLIKKLETQRSREGVREYNNFYELSPELKGSIKKEVEQVFTPARVHHILRKFRIVSQSGPASRDKRASFSKAWKMKGPDRIKYWYPGKAGLPSITIDVHPHTIVAYMDKGQTIAARSKEEAEKMAWYALFQAKDTFIDEQRMFGVHFEIENVGVQIGEAHCGFIFRTDGPYAQTETSLPDKWIDKSVQKELGEGYAELECFTSKATPLEKGVMAMEHLPETIKAAMPEAMKEITDKLVPMNSSIVRVEAMLQGGITISQQYEQMVNFMTRALDEMAEIRKENAELKAKLGI
jgi:predicted transcriptional regulator